jgi:anti-anti-sigma regulatory factor
MRAAELDDDDLRPVRIPLSVNDPNAAKSLTRSVDRMLRDGRTRTPVVVELHGNHLPAPIVAALIGNLRRLREAGGALAASGTTPALRSAMALHGLDRILSSSAGRPAGAPRRRSATGETAWPAFALMLLVVTIASVMVLLQQGPGYGGI